MGYELLLFAHILAVIAWIGSGFFLQVIVTMADRARDDAAFASLLRYNSILGTRLFMPASILTFVFGVLLTIDGPWSFGSLWIVLALLGFAATFATGLLLLKPEGERLAEMLERDGGVLGTDTRHAAQRLLVLARLDYVVLLVVVFDMAVKPTGDDAWAIVVMVLAIVAGAVLIAGRVRALEAGAPRASGPAPA